MKTVMTAVCIFALWLTVPTISALPRSPAVRLQFLHSLGLTRTPPGCQVDHWVPLHCGGPDAVSNMRLTCGKYMLDKEVAERNCATLPAWKKAHPCFHSFVRAMCR